jgi:hypothetical protein
MEKQLLPAKYENAFYEGEKAKQKGKAESDNPYAEGTPQQYWWANGYGGTLDPGFPCPTD